MNVALVNQLIPVSAKLPESEGGYDWSDEYIETLMTARSFTPTEAVRYFWLQRVTETAEYIDMGKPLSQIHHQARGMLDYWDNILGKAGAGAISPNARSPLTFGEIEHP